MRVSKCPQAAIVRCAARAEPAVLLSAQGLNVHLWQLGSALDRQHQVCTAVTLLAVPKLQICLLCCDLYSHTHYDTQGLVIWCTPTPALGQCTHTAAFSCMSCSCLQEILIPWSDSDVFKRCLSSVGCAAQAARLSGWEHTEGYPVDVVREPLHLAHIRAKGPEHISAAAVSPDGQLIAFAGAAVGSLRLYRLSRMEVRSPARIPPMLACMARNQALGLKHISTAAILLVGHQQGSHPTR